jgi:putative exporter of polyketide antibiotics
LQKFTKPPNRWSIKERMIGDSVITILSWNHPRTWKSYTPHRYQGKGWIKCLLI